MDKLKHIGFQRSGYVGCVGLKLLILNLKKKYPAIVMYCTLLSAILILEKQHLKATKYRRNIYEIVANTLR
jgi:hypothetical protein